MSADDSPVLLACSKCKQMLPLRSFARAARNTNRFQKHSWCTPCVVADNLRRRRQNREKYQALGRQHARRKRVRSYGIEPEDYDRMFAEQNGVCAICCRPEKHKPSLCIDHDHATGKVRGLLCFYCNTGIGKLGDDPRLIRKAADYIERSRLA